jgi:hypothetical protein
MDLSAFLAVTISEICGVIVFTSNKICWKLKIKRHCDPFTSRSDMVEEIDDLKVHRIAMTIVKLKKIGPLVHTLISPRHVKSVLDLNGLFIYYCDTDSF